MDFRKNFSNKLSKLRKKNKISLQALGNELGISNQAVSLLEKGHNSPSFDVLCKLACYFNVSVDYLIGRTDQNQSKSKNTSLSDEDKEILKLYNQLDSLDKNIIKGKISEMIKGKGEEDTEFSVDLAT